MQKRTIKCGSDQLSLEFVQGMSDRMDVSFYKYGDYRSNYKGRYSPEFLKELSSRLRELVAQWKGRGTTAHGNALMFAFERLLLYVDGGNTKSGTVERGNTEYLMDAANGLMIEFECPQVPNAGFEATDDKGSPGFSGLSLKEAKDFKDQNPD